MGPELVALMPIFEGSPPPVAGSRDQLGKRIKSSLVVPRPVRFNVRAYRRDNIVVVTKLRQKDLNAGSSRFPSLDEYEFEFVRYDHGNSQSPVRNMSFAY